MMSGVRRVFVDTAWNRKPHACYDPLTDRFFEARKLTDLKDYDEIYLDSLLFPGIWSELRELIAEGRQVYYFTRPWRWRELRERFKDGLRERFKTREVKKTDYGDSYVLWKVYETGISMGNVHKWFKPITIVDVELRPLLMKEELISRAVDKLDTAIDLGVKADEVEEDFGILGFVPAFDDCVDPRLKRIGRVRLLRFLDEPGEDREVPPCDRGLCPRGSREG